MGRNYSRGTSRIYFDEHRDQLPKNYTLLTFSYALILPTFAACSSIKLPDKHDNTIYTMTINLSPNEYNSIIIHIHMRLNQ